MAWDKLLIIDPTDDVRPLVEPDAKRQRLELHSVTGTGLNALETAFELRPAIVLINVTIPAARPLDVVARVCDALPSTVVIKPDWEIDHDGRLLRAAQDGEPFILRHRSGAAARTMFDVAKVTLGLASRPPNHRPPARRWLHAFGRHAVDRR